MGGGCCGFVAGDSRELGSDGGYVWCAGLGSRYVTQDAVKTAEHTAFLPSCSPLPKLFASSSPSFRSCGEKQHMFSSCSASLDKSASRAVFADGIGNCLTRTHTHCRKFRGAGP